MKDLMYFNFESLLKELNKSGKKTILEIYCNELFYLY